MKKLFAAIFLVVGLSAFGATQGTAVRALDGTATNLSTIGVITNLGTMTIQVGANAFGSGFQVIDTNGTPRYQLQGAFLNLIDTNGNIALRIGTDGALLSSGQFTGNGGGLTNLVGATNFISTVTYNFNGKVTFNAVSYNTNAWAGPTNPIVLTTNYQFFVASTDCEITGVSGQLTGQNTWATLTVSNSTASPITVRSTATGFRPQGVSTSSALIIGAGKEGYLSFHCRDVLSTNFVTTAQQ